MKVEEQKDANPLSPVIIKLVSPLPTQLFDCLVTGAVCLPSNGRYTLGL